ncbi:PspC domain-containing protein [Pseudoalteromonas fenneropenaei]|uniref:PspC domain-containing protein n=1 Tax=Pseudoalteromonas fenneropenaei TaxID=1737459 RepID=A0ABV7CLQ1_9GAMM
MAQYYQQQKTMTRNLSDKKIAGVCSGIAERVNLPVWLTRLLTVLVFFKFPIFIIVAYALAAVCVPAKGQ